MVPLYDSTLMALMSLSDTNHPETRQVLYKLTAQFLVQLKIAEFDDWDWEGKVVFLTKYRDIGDILEQLGISMETVPELECGDVTPVMRHSENIVFKATQWIPFFGTAATIASAVNHWRKCLCVCVCVYVIVLSCSYIQSFID